MPIEKKVVSAITLRQGVTNHLWFLPALATAYLASPVLIAVRKSDKGLWNGTAALIVVLSCSSRPRSAP